MIVNHDHATLFVAPSVPPAVGAGPAGRPEPIANSGAEAMRRLLDPFAVRQPAQPRAEVASNAP